MIVGGYDLHLYCDHPQHVGTPYTLSGMQFHMHSQVDQGGEFFGYNERAAWQAAVAGGWTRRRLIDADNRTTWVVLCPWCRQQGRKVTEIEGPAQ